MEMNSSTSPEFLEYLRRYDISIKDCESLVKSLGEGDELAHISQSALSMIGMLPIPELVMLAVSQGSIYGYSLGLDAVKEE